jgi:hypothetical protein
MLSSFIFMSDIQIMIPNKHLKHKMHSSKTGHSYNQQGYTWKFHLIVEPARACVRVRVCVCVRARTCMCVHTHTHISLGLGFEDSL